MMRSMMSAVSGLRAQQTAMDVIGNNIANVNTAGFKSSNTNFTDLFYQTLQQGSNTVNPEQVGYGSRVGSVDKDMSSTGATNTDNPLDMYISGEGFFAVNTQPDGSGTTYYTRLGNFHIDSAGYLADSNGNYVLGAKMNGSNVVAGGPICLLGATFHSTTGQVIKLDANVYKQLSNIQVNTNGVICASVGDQTGVISNDTVTGVSYSGTPNSGTGSVNASGAVLDASGSPVRDSSGPINLDGMMIKDSSTGVETTLSAANFSKIKGVTFNSDGTLTVSYTDASGATSAGTIEKAPVNVTYTSTPAAGSGSVKSTGELLDSNGDAVSDASGAINAIGLVIKDNTSGVATTVTSGNVSSIQSASFSGGTVTVTYKDASGTTQTGTLQEPRSGETYTGSPSAAGADTDGTIYDASGADVLDANGNPLNILGMAVEDSSGTGEVVDTSNLQYIKNIVFNTDGSITVHYTTSGGTAETGKLVSLKEDEETVGLATFVNSNGLYEAGNSYYTSNVSSGSPSYVIAGEGNSTEVRGSELEMSNVDLAKELTNMITTERGFQANSRVITVSDSMLEELVNLKRS